MSAVPVTSVQKWDTCQKEFQGFCSISIDDKILKTRLMATEDTGIITILLMDELGIPLTVVSATEEEITLKSIFPPMSKSIARLFGLAATAFIQSLQIDPSGKAIIEDLRKNDTPVYYYFSNNTIDSTVVLRRRKKIYTLQYGDNSFSFIGEARDTVCSCRWK